MANSRFAESKESSHSSTNHTVVIEDKYYLRRFLKKTSNIYMYEGIDKFMSRYVSIYLKPVIDALFRPMSTLALTKRSKMNSDRA